MPAQVSAAQLAAAGGGDLNAHVAAGPVACFAPDLLCAITGLWIRSSRGHGRRRRH
jgi:hypothetical protein